MPIELSGLYAITDRQLIGAGELVDAVSAAIEGGARLIQYRDKGADATRRREEASALQALCSARGIPLIVNDDIELASDIGATGVHLGRDDPAIGAARERLGPSALIGVSCYASVERALAAERAGADYVAFGSMFPSSTKPSAERASLAILTEARDRLAIPICAIGGITVNNVTQVIAAGADMVAVISGVFGAADIRTAAAALAAAFPPISEETTGSGSGLSGSHHTA